MRCITCIDGPTEAAWSDDRPLHQAALEAICKASASLGQAVLRRHRRGNLRGFLLAIAPNQRRVRSRSE